MVARRLRGALTVPPDARAADDAPADAAPADSNRVTRPARAVPGQSPRKRARVYRGQRFD
jgi:hypothetical protein